MARSLTHASLMLLAVAVAPMQASAQSPAVLPDPLTFGVELVQAIRSSQAESRLRVVHAMSRRCITAATQPYYDWWFGKQRRVVGAGVPTVTVERFDPSSASLPSDGRSDYPIVPTHRIQLDFADGPQRSSSLITYVAPDGAQWREVLPCPRGDVTERARQRAVEDQEQSERVRAQVAAMPAALRSELRTMLAEGRKVDAIRRYAAAADQDLSTSKAVVESLDTMPR